MITLSLTEIEEPLDEPVEDRTPEIPDDKIIIFDWEEGVEYPTVQISDEDTRRHSDLAIESRYLEAKLKVADEICAALGQPNFLRGKYILDIDLDYFRTAKAIELKDPHTFYELIRKADIITIALKPQYVEWERLEGETVTSDFLLPRLLLHIRSALG